MPNPYSEEARRSRPAVPPVIRYRTKDSVPPPYDDLDKPAYVARLTSDSLRGRAERIMKELRAVPVEKRNTTLYTRQQYLVTRLYKEAKWSDRQSDLFLSKLTDEQKAWDASEYARRAAKRKAKSKVVEDIL